MYIKSKSKTFIAAIVGAFILVGLISQVALAKQLMANSVANLTSQTLYTVPAGQQAFYVNSIIIANDNANSVPDARLYRDDKAMTGFITVPAGSTIQLQFATPLQFTAGTSVVVRNGASLGPIHFTINGFMQ